MKALACIALAGCALTSRSPPPPPIRYFTPEHAEHAERTPPPAPTLRLRLGRIRSAGDLRLPILHRDSPVELTPYETLRWTEQPEAYVRRAVKRALFDERPIEQVVSGPAPTLEVEVIGFEEVTYRQAARVELRYELDDERTAIARGTVAVERRARSPKIEAVVEAMRGALDEAAGELGDRVEAALRTRAGPAPDERQASDAAHSPAVPAVRTQAPALH